MSDEFLEDFALDFTDDGSDAFGINDSSHDVLIEESNFNSGTIDQSLRHSHFTGFGSMDPITDVVMDWHLAHISHKRNNSEPPSYKAAVTQAPMANLPVANSNCTFDVLRHQSTFIG